MQFQVPQNVDIEDKILGPMTPRMFLMALGFVGAAVFVYVAFETTLDAMLVIFAIIISGIAFVFTKPLEMNFEQFLLVWLAFQIKPRERIWFKVKQNVIEIRDQPKANFIEDVVDSKESVSKEDISDLTAILDSAGRSGIKIGKKTEINELKNDFELDYSTSYLRQSSYSTAPSYQDSMDENIDPNNLNNFNNAFKTMLIVPDKAFKNSTTEEEGFISSTKEGLNEVYEDSPLSGFYGNEPISDEDLELQNSNLEISNTDTLTASNQNLYPEADVFQNSEVKTNFSDDFSISQNVAESISQSSTENVLSSNENDSLYDKNDEISNSTLSGNEENFIFSNQEISNVSEVDAETKNSNFLKENFSEKRDDKKKNNVQSLSSSGFINQGEEVDLSNLFK